MITVAVDCIVGRRHLNDARRPPVNILREMKRFRFTAERTNSANLHLSPVVYRRTTAAVDHSPDFACIRATNAYEMASNVSSEHFHRARLIEWAVLPNKCT